MSPYLDWASIPEMGCSDAKRLADLRRIERRLRALHRRASRISDHCLSPYAQCLAGELEEAAGTAGRAVIDEDEAIHERPQRETERRWEIAHASA